MKHVTRCTKGQDLIEYALMASVIAFAVAVLLPDVSLSVSRIFSDVVGALGPQATSALIH